METLRNYIGGHWLDASSGRTAPVHDPATGAEHARVPLSGDADVDRAVDVAWHGQEAWREVPAAQRAGYLARLRDAVARHAEALARAITIDQGKTLDEARAEVRRGLDNLDHALALPALLAGAAVDGATTARRPLGVIAAITPSSFPVLAPLWTAPYAIACGCAIVLKPSRAAPVATQRLVELAHEAGLPAGVVGVVHGDRAAATRLVDHPRVGGVWFAGGAAAARAVAARAAAAGKRVRALGAARHHVIVAPDADLDRAAAAIVEGCLGGAGRLGGSTVIGVGDVAHALAARLAAAARAVVVGSGLDTGVGLGPAPSRREHDRILTAVQQAIDAGATVLLDGRRPHAIKGRPEGVWLGPMILEAPESVPASVVDPVTGPVIVVRRARALREAVALVGRAAASAAILTTSGRTAREVEAALAARVLAVNATAPLPAAFAPVAGTSAGAFGDLGADARDAVLLYTDETLTLARWP